MWRSLEDLRVHLNADYVVALRQAFDALVIGVPEMRVIY